MNAVIGLTGLLLRTDLTPEQCDFVETIRSSGDSLLSLINDILDFSKIDSGKMDLESQPMDLRSCIESSIDLVATKASEKGVTLAYIIEKNTPETVTGDPTRLRQILTNLLSNAVKFTDKGDIEVSVSNKKLESANHEIHFAVKDTGIGISEDEINRLFQPFTQLDSSTSRRYGGTGPWPGHKQEACEDDGGKNLGREPAWLWFNLPLYDIGWDSDQRASQKKRNWHIDLCQRAVAHPLTVLFAYC